MKKLLGILFLSLLLCGNAYSKSDLDTAIENCADAQFFGNEQGIPKSYYENHEVYKSMIINKEILQKNYDEYDLVYQATYKKYLKDNPKPKYPKLETLSTYNFEDYKKASAKWEDDEENYMKPFKEKLLAIAENLKIQDELDKETKRSLVAMNLKKLNLKDKAKTIQDYTVKFTLCESTYNKTPRGFILEWGD